jgi:radical SAM superfamily enzyme YgiQ (UPF0313 family)
MKLLVVNPPKLRNGYYVVREEKVSQLQDIKSNPYTLSSVLGLLSQKLKNVKIFALDAQAEELNTVQTLEKIREQEFDLAICFLSAFTLPHDRIIAENIDRPVVGVLTPSTVNPIEAINFYGLNIPYFTKREIEFTLLKAVKEFANRGKIRKAKGLIINKNGNSYDTGPESFPPLKNLPRPAFEMLPFKEYEEPILLHTVKGCPFRCTYCCSVKVVRSKPIPKVIEEIKFIKDNYGFSNFFFINDEFSIDINYGKRLCKEIIKQKLNIMWKCMNRPDLVDIELLKLMKEAGCYEIAYGIETVSEKLQKIIKKNLKMSTVKKAFHLTHETGINTVAFFMIGLPSETEKDIERNIKFFREIQPTNFEICVTYPSPGGEMYRELSKKGLLLERDWSKYKVGKFYIFKHEYYKNQQEVLKMLRYMRKRFYKILMKQNKLHFFNLLREFVVGNMPSGLTNLLRTVFLKSGLKPYSRWIVR